MIEDVFFETRDHSISSQIDLILNSFDFYSVKKIFDYMDFKYIQGIENEYSPSKEDLIYLAKNLLEGAADKGKKNRSNMTISSGRFEAFWNNEEETLNLKFIPFESEIMLNEEDETIYVV